MKTSINLVFQAFSIGKYGYRKMQFFTLIALVIMTCLSCSPADVVVPNVQYFSPLNASPGGANGPASNKLIVKPYCCPSTAIEVTANTTITDNDIQWLTIPLNGIELKMLSSVTVCYQVVGASGASYISQVRLSEMTTPNTAIVKLDDGVDQKSTTPTCYTSKPATSYSINGTTYLELKIVLAASEKILIGGVSINQ